MDQLNVSSAAHEVPDRPALINQGRIHTFRDLAVETSLLRGTLSRQIPADARVALRATNTTHTVLCILALIEEGVPFVPIHPRLTEDEANALIRDSDAALSLEDEHIAELVAESGVPSARRRSSDLLALIYTSGTTGQPKGALLPRSAFAASAVASTERLGWRDNDRWLLCMPLCHVGGLSILTRCLIARRTVVLHERFDAGAVLRSIRDDKVTLLSVVPTMLSALLEADDDDVLPDLRAIIVGGAACPPPLLAEAVARGVPALTTYGLTEACSQVTLQPLHAPPLFEPGSGLPLAGTEITILDDHGQPVGPGTLGRIHVRGPTLMRGYWRQPPLEGAFDTGDLGSLDDVGRLHVSARRTDLIVTGGENVSPAEVERVLGSMPDIHEVLVFGTPDDRWGQIVSAAIVGHPDPAAFRQYIEKHLAAHKRPRLIAFVESVPVTPSGKPDRLGAAKALAESLKPLE